VEHEANRAYARRNEEMLRGANVHLEREAELRGKPDSALTDVLCECAEACGGRISMTFDEWDAIHRHENRFAVALGHEDPHVERVISSCDRYVVVEKLPVTGPQ
jgi:hypothetical protein